LDLIIQSRAFSRRHVVRLSRRPSIPPNGLDEDRTTALQTTPLVQLNGTSKTGMPNRWLARTRTTMALPTRSRRTNRVRHLALGTRPAELRKFRRACWNRRRTCLAHSQSSSD